MRTATAPGCNGPEVSTRYTITVTELASRLGVGRTTAWSMVNNGTIPRVQVGGPRSRVLIRVSDVEAWLASAATIASPTTGGVEDDDINPWATPEEMAARRAAHTAATASAG